MSTRRSTLASPPMLSWGDVLCARKCRRRQLRRLAAVGAFGIATLLATAVYPPVPRLVWNASDSVRIGLYAVSPRAPVRPGDMVIARVPEPVRRFAATRRYLPLNVPLVKRVGATSGDEVCGLGQDIFVNRRWLAERQFMDSAGRPIPTWSGCLQLSRDQFFLLTDNPASFDGRYFGVTKGTDIIGKARLIWPR